MARSPHPPDPITVTFEVGLDTPISDRYVQTGEDTFSSSPVTVLDLIVERAAQQLAKSVLADRDLNYSRDLRARAFKRIDEIIDKRVEPIVDEVLGGEFRRTNTLGEFVGEPITLRALMVDAAKKQMTVGKNNSLGSQSRTAIDEAIATTAKSVIAKELADAVTEAKETLKASLTQSTAEVLTDAIAKAVVR